MRRFVLGLISILLILGLCWVGANRILIPRIILPWVKSFILDMAKTQAYKIKINNIEYHPFKGFLIKNFVFYLPKDQKLFEIKEIDLDLNYFELLQRKIEISKFKLFDVNLEIVRDKHGKYNFDKLVRAKMFSAPSKGFTVIVKEINFYDSRIKFADLMARPKAFQREFSNIKLTIKNPQDDRYLLYFCGNNDKESLTFNLDYKHNKGAFSGKAVLKSRLFNQYNECYLKSYLLPWKIALSDLAVDLSFDYQKKSWQVQGKVSVKKVIARNEDVALTGNTDLDFKILKGKIIYLYATASNLAFDYLQHLVFDKGSASIVMDGHKIIIKEFMGQQVNDGFNLKGMLLYSPFYQLAISGEAFGAGNDFTFKYEPHEKASFHWKINAGVSCMDLVGAVNDMNNLAFTSKISGQLDLSQWQDGIKVHMGRPAIVSLEVAADDLQGQMKIDGQLQGQILKPDKWTGSFGINFQDFSVCGIEPLDFNLNLSSQSGVFQTEIPLTRLFKKYKGTIAGILKLDVENWGLELNIKDLDLSALSTINNKFQGLKGNFSGKTALVGKWGSKDAIIGGGYIDLEDCDLKDAPIIADAEEGIRKYQKDFKMPNFKKVEGNFDVKSQRLLFDNVCCKAENLDLRISGSCGFNGEVSATAGIKMFGGSRVKTMRQILLPVTIGLDWMANSVQVKVKGVLPDLSQTTSVMPMNWLNEFFGTSYKADPDQYSLNKLW